MGPIALPAATSQLNCSDPSETQSGAAPVNLDMELTLIRLPCLCLKSSNPFKVDKGRKQVTGYLPPLYRHTEKMQPSRVLIRLLHVLYPHLYLDISSSKVKQSGLTHIHTNTTKGTQYICDRSFRVNHNLQFKGKVYFYFCSCDICLQRLRLSLGSTMQYFKTL